MGRKENHFRHLLNTTRKADKKNYSVDVSSVVDVWLAFNRFKQFDILDMKKIVFFVI